MSDNVLRIYEAKLKKYKGIELPESILQMLFDEAKTEAYYSEKYKGGEINGRKITSEVLQ